MSNARLTLYREAMDLEAKREALQAEIDQIASRLANVQSHLLSGGAPQASAKRYSAPMKTGKQARSGRGELKARILEALANAGSAGLRVKDLAASLRTKPANIYAWFKNATKTNRQIKKVAAAHYRIEGGTPESSPVRRTRKMRRSSESSRPTGKRGELASRIMEALQNAGKSGMKLRDLAEKLGTKYQNLSVWFATTGKKNKAIKKIGAGHYRLQG